MASYQKRNNKWSVRFRIIENGTEKNKRLSGYDRKKDAEKAYMDYMANYKATTKIGDMTFGELYQEYKKYIPSRLKSSSVVDKDYIISKHILPKFENTKMSKITKPMLLDWQKTIDHYSFKHKTNIRNHFSAVWNYGVMYFDICPNLFKQIEPFRKPNIKKEMLFWTQEEFKQFTSVIDSRFWKTFFSFLYLTGCRIGEVRAIQWQDVKDNYVDINKSITNKLSAEERAKGMTYKIVTPKNSNSYRKILISDNLIKLLNGLDKETTFVFDKNNKPISEQSIYKALKSYCDISGVKKIRVHDFRHSHASLLINNDINIYVVSARLGHKNVKETFDTYGHLYPSKAYTALPVLDFEI